MGECTPGKKGMSKDLPCEEVLCTSDMLQLNTQPMQAQPAQAREQPYSLAGRKKHQTGGGGGGGGGGGAQRGNI